MGIALQATFNEAGLPESVRQQNELDINTARHIANGEDYDTGRAPTAAVMAARAHQDNDPNSTKNKKKRDFELLLHDLQQQLDDVREKIAAKNEQLEATEALTKLLLAGQLNGDPEDYRPLFDDAGLNIDDYIDPTTGQLDTDQLASGLIDHTEQLRLEIEELKQEEAQLVEQFSLAEQHSLAAVALIESDFDAYLEKAAAFDNASQALDEFRENKQIDLTVKEIQLQLAEFKDDNPNASPDDLEKLQQDLVSQLEEGIAERVLDELANDQQDPNYAQQHSVAMTM